MSFSALSEVAEINPPGPKNTIRSDDLLDFVPMADVSENGMIHVSEKRPYSAVQKGFTAFRKGDILVAKITPCYENNKIALAEIDTEYGFGSTEFHVVRCDHSKLEKRYLLHLLRADEVREVGEKRMTGSAGQKRVPKSFLEQLQIPLPPLDEQKRIAAILDQADALRRLRQRSLDRLNTLSQAIFYEMFGDMESITNWLNLGDVTTKIGSGATPRGGDNSYKKVGVPLIRSMNVRDGFFDTKGLAFLDARQADGLKNVIVQARDVLLNITGASVARVCLAPTELANARVNQHVAIIRPTVKILPEFLEAFMLLPKTKSELLRIAEAGATRQAITKSQIEDFNVPAIPVSEQQQFVDRRNKAVKQIGEVNSQLNLFNALFASLQHRAFRGEL